MYASTPIPWLGWRARALLMRGMPLPPNRVSIARMYRDPADTMPGKPRPQARQACGRGRSEMRALRCSPAGRPLKRRGQLTGVSPSRRLASNVDRHSSLAHGSRAGNSDGPAMGFRQADRDGQIEALLAPRRQEQFRVSKCCGRRRAAAYNWQVRVGSRGVRVRCQPIILLQPARPGGPGLQGKRHMQKRNIQ